MSDTFCTYGESGTGYGDAGEDYGVCGLENRRGCVSPDNPETTTTPFDMECTTVP